MKTKHIRIAVAECLGWKLSPPNQSWPNPYWTDPKDNVLKTFEELPNYPDSLDACAEFEKTLTDEELDRYARELVFLMKTGEPRVFMSPPLRRSIGYLRVKGKWTEKGSGTV